MEIASFASGNANGTTNYSILVKGDLTVTGMLVSQSGFIIYGGDLSLNNTVYFHDSNSSLEQSSNFPIDFSATSQFLQNLATTWASYNATGNYSLVYTTLTLTCGSSSSLEIFSIPSESFPVGFTLQFSNCDSSKTIIINIGGSIVTLESGSITYGSVDQSQVVFNLYQAISLSIQDAIGSAILAPYAHVNGSSGSICQLFAKSFVGSKTIEFHKSLNGASCWFNGCTSPSTPAPTVSPTSAPTTASPTTIANNVTSAPTTLAPTAAPTTAAPTNTSGATCATIACPAGLTGCCDDVVHGPTCFNTSIASCPSGAVGPILCGFQEHGADFACGTTCYDAVDYLCCDEKLYNIIDSTAPCFNSTTPTGTHNAASNLSITLISSFCAVLIGFLLL